MADGIVQVPPDSTGKKVRTVETVVGGNTVEQQVVTLADASGTVDNAGVALADGKDVAQGATTDAAVTTDVTGTNSGRLRGVVKMLASAWDAANGRLKVDGSGVTQPVSISSQNAVPVRGAGDIDKQILSELRRMNGFLAVLAGIEITERDVEVQ